MAKAPKQVITSATKAQAQSASNQLTKAMLMCPGGVFLPYGGGVTCGSMLIDIAKHKDVKKVIKKKYLDELKAIGGTGIALTFIPFISSGPNAAASVKISEIYDAITKQWKGVR